MRTFKTSLKLDLPDRFDNIAVAVIATGLWENDGIGSYEFWGAKGYDSGSDYAHIDNVVLDPDHSFNDFLSGQQRKDITGWIDDDDNFDLIVEQLGPKVEEHYEQ